MCSLVIKIMKVKGNRENIPRNFKQQPCKRIYQNHTPYNSDKEKHGDNNFTELQIGVILKNIFKNILLKY